MASRIRSLSKLNVSQPCRRFLSSPSILLNEEILASNSNIEAKVLTTLKSKKIVNINDYLKDIPSERFKNEVNIQYATSELRNFENLTKSEKLKHEIYKLLQINNYKAIMDLLLKWSEMSLDDLFGTLTRKEFSYILKKIITHQYKILFRDVSDAPIRQSKGIQSKTKKKREIEAASLLDSIRNLYGNIIYKTKNSTDSIYHKSKRRDLYASSSLSGYRLQVEDYENLIILEYHNLKFDLVNKWFERFETEFPKNYQELMTYKMWIYKFYVQSYGSPRGWPLKPTDISSRHYDPKFSNVKHTESYKKIFSDFLKATHQSPTKFILNNELAETLIYSIGYSGNLDEMFQFIVTYYGIDPDGKLDPSFQIYKKDDIQFPNLSIVKAIMVSLSYNKEFFKGMKYVSAFEDIYGIKLSGFESRPFWEQAFKWCDYSTEFEEKRSLAYFLNQTSKESNKNKINKREKSLTEVQQDVNFDYEGFLVFLSNLKNERINTFNELWKLYQQVGGGYFSKRLYKVYLDYLKQELVEDKEKIESQYYEYLKILLKHYEQYELSYNTFNSRDYLKFGTSKRIDEFVYILYEEAMKSLIDYKWKSTYAGQCIPLINKWSIDEDMKENLTKFWEQERLPQYRKMIEKKRQEFMISLRSEEKDDESLLDLL
ncbi:mitochondrial ATPase expression-domain-containing protein [Scheffersomyces amazonensis]|uniref:mitochondrial ATPase expression-domain-containing protein n=1 Tax=Scheffersomyces amazonensis TaxID=1078765 RepID=UPI00315CD7B7